MARAKDSLKRLLPLYAVVFAGFVGYSLMITVFTPMIMSNHDLLLRADEPMSRRVILLGILLCLYPLGQFAGSPVLGALSDRFGRKPVLMISLCITTGCYALIAIALSLRSVALLALASLLAGLAEANVVAAQSAIADVITPEERSRFFGYIYLSASSAYIVGPLVGGKLADPDLVSWFSNATPFWAARHGEQSSAQVGAEALSGLVGGLSRRFIRRASLDPLRARRDGGSLGAEV